MDFDDDAFSQTTEDPETNAIHRQLVDLSDSMAAAAISVNHYPEAFLQRSSLSTDHSILLWQKRSSSSCGSGSSLPESSPNERAAETDDGRKNMEEDAKSFVSVDLND